MWVFVGSGVRGGGGTGRQGGDDAGVFLRVGVPDVRLEVGRLREVPTAKWTVERPDAAVRQDVTLQL